MVPSRNLP